MTAKGMTRATGKGANSKPSTMLLPYFFSLLPAMRNAKYIAAVLRAAGAVLLFQAGTAAAHPHVFADGHVILDLNPKRELVAVTNEWKFDAPFSAFAVTGLDKNHDGKYSAAELKPLAQTSMDSLKDYHFFTRVLVKGGEEEFSGPRDYSYRFVEGRLILDFTMPLDKPVPVNQDLKVEVFDPEYFVAYTFPDHGAVEVRGAKGCTAAYTPPKPLDAKMIAELAAIPADQHDLPEALADAAAGLAHIFTAECR